MRPRLKRRALLTLCAVAAARSVPAQGRPRITILHSGFPDRTPIHLLFEALRALGYENGRTATIDVLGAMGDADRLRTLVGAILADPPNVVIALTSPAVLALKSAGATMPVVFAFVSDPVMLGIVASLARPGANFTGVTFSEGVLGGKRLELLADTLPGLQRVAIIWANGFPDNVAIVEAARGAAQTRQLDPFIRKLDGVGDLAAAFSDASRAGAQAVVFVTDNAMFGRRTEVAALALAHRLPSIHAFPVEAEDGALMSYGPDLGESYRRAAALTDRILKGAKPADLPVEQPTAFQLVLNLKTAKALDVTFPPTILGRADQVIE
jgi:putative ABC transport system substrate-binding protein